MIEVEIDMDLRVGVNNMLTFAGITDIRGEYIPYVGSSVTVVDVKSGRTAVGVVIAFNPAAMLIYIAVAWHDLTTDDVPVEP